MIWSLGWVLLFPRVGEGSEYPDWAGCVHAGQYLGLSVLRPHGPAPDLTHRNLSLLQD
jgi:hypothetical protein